MSLEGNEVYYTFQGQAMDNTLADGDAGDKVPIEESLRKFVKFIREWQHDNMHIYR
jgi:hypothetical protein